MSSDLLLLSGGRPQSYNLYGWGENGFNQLGTNGHNFPIAQLTNGAFGTQSIAQVASGDGHRLFLTTTGDVYSWGANGTPSYGTTVVGQLGTGTSNLYTQAPTFVMSGVAQISAGVNTSMAVKTDGTIWWWGSVFDTSGATIYNTTPVQVPQTSSVTNCAEVHCFSGNGFMYRTTTGEVWVLGTNASGRFGTGGGNVYASPAQITGLPANVIKISGGVSNGYAVTSGGSLYGWGAASGPGCGDNSGIQNNTPVQVKYNSTGAVVTSAIDVRAVSGANTCLFRITPGTGPDPLLTNCYGFGNNNFYQLTINNTGTSYNSAVPIYDFLDFSGTSFPAPIEVTAICGGEYSTGFVTSGGYLCLCGANDVGQGGKTNFSNIVYPQAVNTSNTWTNVFLAPQYNTFDVNIYNYTQLRTNAYGVNSSNQLWATGTNYKYTLGRTNELNAVTKIGNNYEWLQVVQGGLDNCFTVAIKSDKTLWSVGSNYSGGLGFVPVYSNETLISSLTRTKWYPTFTQVGALTWNDVAAGGGHVLAVTTGGTVYGWGFNQYGQTAIGSTALSTTDTPQAVSTAGGFSGSGSFVSAGVDHSVVIDLVGSVWACGRNDTGQVGDNSTVNKSSFVPVRKTGSLSQLNNITQVASGYGFSIALDTSGEIWGWGANDDGQLGDGTTTAYYNTAQPTLWKSTIDAAYGYSVNIIEIAAGLFHTLVLLDNGRVWACGYNAAGQLGDGGSTSTSTPVLTFGLSDVVAIGASQFTSYALKSNGAVVFWGLNKHTDYSASFAMFYTNPYEGFVNNFSTTSTYPFATQLTIKSFPQSIAKKSPCAQMCQFLLAGG